MKTALQQSLPSLTIVLIVTFLTFTIGSGLISGQDSHSQDSDDTPAWQVENDTHSPTEIHDSETSISFLSGQKPIVIVLFMLVVFILVAKLGGEIMERIHQPAVLGELIVGVIIGNLSLIGVDQLEFIKHNHFIELLAG
jgi:hypothetical protein